jgi:hypothetical protein
MKGFMNHKGKGFCPAYGGLCEYDEPCGKRCKKYRKKMFSKIRRLQAKIEINKEVVK